MLLISEINNAKFEVFNYLLFNLDEIIYLKIKVFYLIKFYKIINYIIEERKSKEFENFWNFYFSNFNIFIIIIILMQINLGIKKNYIYLYWNM